MGTYPAQLQRCERIAHRSGTPLQHFRQPGQQGSLHRSQRPRDLCLQYESGSQARTQNPMSRPNVRCRARVEDQEGLQQLADALEASLDAGRRQTRFQPFIPDVRLLVCPKWLQPFQEALAGT